MIITSGTLTVGNTTYPLAGILSFRVSSSGTQKQHWPNTFKAFYRWFAGLSVGALALVAYATMTSGFSWWYLIGLLCVAVGGATWTTVNGDHRYTEIDRYWLNVQTTSGTQGVVSSPNQDYIRALAGKLGQAMADRG